MEGSGGREEEKRRWKVLWADVEDGDKEETKQ
jgi:hypothetical protein